VRTKQFDYVHAESLFRSAVNNAETWSGQPKHLAAALNNLAFLFRVQNKHADAESIYERSIATWQSALGPEDAHVALGLSNLSMLCHLRGDVSAAESLSMRALEIYKKAFGTEHAEIARTLNDISEFLRVQARYPEAESICRASAAMREKIFGTESPEHAQSLNNLALILELQGKYDEALPAYQQSLQVFEDTVDDGHPDVARVLHNFSAYYRLTGKYSEAERLLQAALRIQDKQSQNGHRQGLQDLIPLQQLEQTLSIYRGLLEYAEPGVPWPVPTLRERPLMAEHDHALDAYARSVRQLKIEMQQDQQKMDRARLTVERMGPWYHNIQLAPGIFTNPKRGDYPASRWRTLEPHVPPDLSGKTVLDIGCNSGFFSLELKKRGAERVVGIDIMPHILAQARFVSSWLEQPLELRELGVYDLDRLGTFDIVFFIGVLYHLKHPLLALEQVAAACKDTLYVQTVLRGSIADFDPPNDYDENEHNIFEEHAFPKLHFIEHSFNGDVSNWWFANRSCFKAMLRITGFESIQDTASPDMFVCRKPRT